MARGWFRRHRLLGLVMALTAVAMVQAEERYFTWVDEHGNVRHTPIRDEVDPIEERAKAVEEARGAADRVPHRTASGAPQGPVAPPEDAVVEAETTRENASRAAEPVAASRDDDVEAMGEVQAASPGTKPGRPAPERATPPEESANSALDDTEYTLDNYPDGDALAQDGFVRDGDPLPYFTWRDAHGNLRVDYYRPEPGFEKTPQPRSSKSLTSGLVIDRDSRAVPAANAEALAVLGIDGDQTLLARWLERCCDDLPLQDLAQWDDSREFQLDLDDMAPSYRFASGESVYRLVRLPPPEEASAFVVQVRSYIDGRVFVPTLVFLDQDMVTRRLVTDLAFDFAPENWHRLGYLEARVPVFPARGERWLLILSRQEDQAGQTVIESERGPRVVHHAAHGLLGLAPYEP